MRDSDQMSETRIPDSIAAACESGHPPAGESSSPAQRHRRGAKSPRVSIIMNVRNGAAYVRDALDGVLAQTFGRLGARLLG